jgi:Stress responsive A/B Barrel Domain
MPFRHVVMFTWSDHVDGDHIDEVRARLSALPSEIDVIRNYVHGSDVGVSEGNFDYCVVADFDNVADYRLYRDHPAHVLLIEEMITGNVAARAAVQYQTGPR